MSSLFPQNNWCFTLNNPDDLQAPRRLDASFCVWQLERGSNGTPHLQGYAIFTKSVRLSALKKKLPSAHFEPKRGSTDQAIAYCRKESTRVDGPWEYGKRPKQGKRSDLLAVKATIDSGADEKAIAEAHFVSYVKYRRNLIEYQRLVTPQRNFKSIVTVFYGSTGTHKSTRLQHNFPDAAWITRPIQSQSCWFDAYSGQRTVIFDEFYAWLPYDFLLRIMDRTPLTVQTKGGHTTFRPRNIFFTCGTHPSKWYDYNKMPQGYAPVQRRIENIVETFKHDDGRILEFVHVENGVVVTPSPRLHSWDLPYWQRPLAEQFPIVLDSELQKEATPEEVELSSDEGEYSQPSPFTPLDDEVRIDLGLD